MPFNGSGTFVRIRNWVNDATAGIKIRADRHDSEDDNFASGLSQCITKDGQTTITANLPMATYRHTGVGAAVNATDYARYDQVQLGKSVWAVAGGTADAITATYSPSTTAPVDGQLYFVRATAANATTTPTFAPDGQTARTITKYGNQALGAGDIFGAGHEIILRYRSSDTKYELLNPSISNLYGNVSGGNTHKLVNMEDGTDAQDYVTKAQLDANTQDASTTIKGIVELATNAETITGTDATRAVTPAGLQDKLDNDLVKSKTTADQTITSGGLLTIAHGLTGTPKPTDVVADLVCLTAEDGWSIDDVLPAQRDDAFAGAAGYTVYTDATNIYVRFGSNASVFGTLNKNTGASSGLINSNFNIRFHVRIYP